MEEETLDEKHKGTSEKDFVRKVKEMKEQEKVSTTNNYKRGIAKLRIYEKELAYINMQKKLKEIRERR